MRLALTFFSVLQMPIPDILTCAIEAERAGFEYVSLAESYYRDASVLSCAIASKTSKIKLGSSIYPITTRTPFQIAMATSTLNEFSNGRIAFIGLGIGYRDRIEQYFGIKISDPITKMMENTQIIKGLLSGEKFFSFNGKFYNFQNFPKITYRPLSIPILFGSSGDKMLNLAGKIADGVILNSIGTEEYFKHVKSILYESAKESGKRPDVSNLEIAASTIFSVADKDEDAINAARYDILFYVLYPELDPVIKKTPYIQKVKEIRKANSQGNNKEALSLVTDDMVRSLAIVGQPKECRDKVRRLYSYGITLPIIRVSIKPFKEDKRKEIFLRAIEVLKN